MVTPRSIRFEPSTDEALASFVARHAGLSFNSAVGLLVEEGLRADAHRGVFFREGPAGRRAVLVAGPDVWEVVRAVKSARAAEPDLGAEELLALVSELTGVPDKQLRVAVDYYADYPHEIDVLLAEADRAEAAAEAAMGRRRELLGS